jgi:H+/Cl- antiporter ClcA
MVWCLFTQFLWVHTFYIVGANFFRNIKFSWLFTSIVLFVLFLAGIYLLNSFVENGRQVTLYIENHTWQFSFLFLALSIFHVWLAYRLFCRRQLVGRFFNC